ncbi:hypothetical protein C8054_25335 [Micromonospora sp. RP3T]|nr:hypothetical protein C8054_25335 [Micromonospora sp. RP3T]
MRLAASAVPFVAANFMIDRGRGPWGWRGGGLGWGGERVREVMLVTGGEGWTVVDRGGTSVMWDRRGGR